MLLFAAPQDIAYSLGKHLFINQLCIFYCQKLKGHLVAATSELLSNQCHATLYKLILQICSFRQYFKPELSIHIRFWTSVFHTSPSHASLEFKCESMFRILSQAMMFTRTRCSFIVQTNSSRARWDSNPH